MKTRVKTTKKTKKWHDHDYWVRKHPTADAWINLMTFIRSVMMMRGIDTIVEEAVRYANKRGERVSLRWGAKPRSQERLRLCLENTEKAVKAGGPTSVRAFRKTVRLWAGKNPDSGYGGVMGFTTAIGKGPYLPRFCICTMLHELTHTIHLTSVNEYQVAGKRRPHDICYNRIQLKLMQKVFKLTEKDLSSHPKYHGYSLGRGYAPSTSAYGILRKLIDDQDPRVMKWFTAEQPVVKEKKKRGPSKTAWLNTISAVTGCDIAWWPDDLDELKIWPCHVWGEKRDKIEAGVKLTAEELKMLANTIDEVVWRLEAEADKDHYYGQGSLTKYDGRIDTMMKGYRWWLENVQNAGGGV